MNYSQQINNSLECLSPSQNVLEDSQNAYFSL